MQNLSYTRLLSTRIKLFAIQFRAIKKRKRNGNVVTVKMMAHFREKYWIKTKKEFYKCLILGTISFIIF